MISFLRRNAIALLALFIALGGTSFAAVIVTSNSQVAQDTISGHKPPSGDHANIISGSVGGADLGNGSVSNSKIKSNAVTGGKVDESTLSRVPDSARLGGVDAADFRPGTAMGAQETDQCAASGTWSLCAPVTLTVPDGKFFKVSVVSSMTVWGTGSGTGGLFCAATDGPACINSHPSGFSDEASRYTNVTNSGTDYYGPGTHHFGMAVRADIPVGVTNTAYTTTTIRWHSYDAELASGAAATKAPSRPPHVMTPKPLR